VGKKNCIDKDKTAVLGVDYMCMRYIDSDEYRAMGDDNWICKKLDTPYKCTSYKREDLCNIDYCNFGPCKWEQNKCVYK